jgi:hypothetical protein
MAAPTSEQLRAAGVLAAPSDNTHLVASSSTGNDQQLPLLRHGRQLTAPDGAPLTPTVTQHSVSTARLAMITVWHQKLLV